MAHHQWSLQTALPLEGVRVIELGHSVAAPYAGLVLAELGAQVVKVEKPGSGDDARGWGPPWHEGVSATWLALNRNKTSVAVDLRRASDRDRLAALAADADVIIQNLKPGHASELGLGPDTLLERNPRLVYASIWAFGAVGPMAGLPGYDPLMQAFGGIMSVTGDEGRPPVRVGTSIIDMGAGMWVVIAIISALLKRTTTGKGGLVETSLYETALGWMVYHAAGFTASGITPKRFGSGIGMIVPYQVFTAADGELVIGGGNDKLFGLLSGVLGHREWAEDPKFRSNGDRVANRADLCGRIAAIVATKPVAHWEQALRTAGVPCAPVQDMAQVMAHAQTQALGIVRGDASSAIGYLGLPITFDGVRPSLDEPPPALGNRSDILDLGWTPR